MQTEPARKEKNTAKRAARKLVPGVYERLLTDMRRRIEERWDSRNNFAVKNGIHTTQLNRALDGQADPRAPEFFRWLELLGLRVFAGADLDKLHEHFVPVPKVVARPRLGDGSLETDADVEGFYAFQQKYLARRAPGGDVVLMEVQGDSMAPTINSGDMVLVDQRQTKSLPGRVYLLRIEDTLTVKRLEKMPGKLVLIGDNPAHGRTEIPLDDVDGRVEIKGRVIWAAKEL